MANYIASARTSYVKVRDAEKFEEWASGICADLQKIESEKHGTLYAFLFDQDDCGAIPDSRYDESTDEFLEMDIFGEIQPHIADGWGISFVEAGAEKLRHVHGFAAVVTPSDIKLVDLCGWVNATMKDLEVEGWD